MTDILDRQLLPSEQAMESRVGDETVILHLDRGTYYGLDPLGTAIWELIKQGMNPGGIRDTLIKDYGASREEIEADMRCFLNELYAHGIIVDGPVDA